MKHKASIRNMTTKRKFEMETLSSQQNISGAVKISINDLPEEMLVGIFSHLPLSDRKNARLVCQLWHQLSYDFTLIQKDVTVLRKNCDLIQNSSPCSKHVNIRIATGRINKKYLAIMGNSESFWKNHCQNLRSLDLRISCSDLLVMSEIFLHLPLLEQITLFYSRDCSNGHDVNIFSEKVQFPNLERVLLYGNCDLLLAILKVTMMRAPKLVSVVVALEKYDFISEKYQNFWNLDFRPTANLKEIFFMGDRYNDFITDMVDIFGTNLEMLTLMMGAENGSSFPPLERIFRRCVNLKHLMLKLPFPCPTSSLVIPSMTLNSLTSISLGYSEQLTDNMIASLAVLNNLAHFELFCTPVLTPRGIYEIFGRRERPKMVELRLENVSFLSNNYDIMVEITPNLPNLKVLYLSNCIITNKSLESLITRNPSLQCLTLKGKYCERLPYAALSSNKMSHLIHLDIFRTTIPQKILQDLELPSLKYLFCKYKNFQPKGASQSLRVEKICCYDHNKLLNTFGSYGKRHSNMMSCCKSPFVDVFCNSIFSPLYLK